MFFPGETVLHTFVIPFSSKDVAQVVVSYKQNEAIIMEKSVTGGFKPDGDNVCSVEIEFTQQDSLLFSDNAAYTIQINVYTSEGTRHTSHEMKSSSGIQYLRDFMPTTEIQNPVAETGGVTDGN